MTVTVPVGGLGFRLIHRLRRDFLKSRARPGRATTAAGMGPQPLFTFGVIADIQYADIEDGYNFSRTTRRFYRSSLLLLRRALDSWSFQEAVKPSFILQLGDIIDGFNKPREASQEALETVLGEFRSGAAQLPVHHAWGNHEFYNFNRSFLLRSELNSTPAGGEQSSGGAPLRPGSDIYAYHFSPAPGFRFVVLDAYDESLLGREEGTEQYDRAMGVIRTHNHNEDLNSPPEGDLMQRFTKFNGGFSKEQLDWLQVVLTSADDKQERVTLVSHLPVHARSTTAVCLAWNFDAVLQLLRCHRSVVCFVAGHDHDGGYWRDEETGVHHVTLEGVIETAPHADAYGTVEVYEDRMVLRGRGRIAERVLAFPT